MFEAFTQLKSGGAWLGRARAWMQSKKHNGSTVTWGSQEILLPYVTVRDLEEVAALSAQEALKESQAGKDLATLGELLDAGLLVPQEAPDPEDNWKVRQFLGRLDRYRKPEEAQVGIAKPISAPPGTPRCEHVFPTGRCEREPGHDGNCMTSQVRAPEKRADECPKCKTRCCTEDLGNGVFRCDFCGTEFKS